MKSPNTGKVMLLKRKTLLLNFRKEPFEIRYHYYLCEDTAEEFTTDALDEINIKQVHNQYREKYGVPFPEEIVDIREKYGLSAARMSEILGLGVNTYRLYESGEMPSIANGRLILSVREPEAFIRQVQASSHFLSTKEMDKLIAAAKKIQEEEALNSWNYLFEEKIFHTYNPCEYNGYKTPDLDKVAEVISYLDCKRIPLYKTKLNKLLFYADFYCYGQFGHSLTGTTYKAIPFGPVPSEYDKMYIKLCDDEKINIKTVNFNDEIFGEKIETTASVKTTLQQFEIDILDTITEKFKSFKTDKIVKVSHDEPAWIDNAQDKSLISYQKYAFNLVAFS